MSLARSPAGLVEGVPAALPVEPAPEGEPPVLDVALLPDGLPDWFSIVPVTSTRRFTSLFISPMLPVSRYVCCADTPAAPLLVEAPGSAPVLLGVPGFPAGAPALPVLPVDDGVPVPLLPVREPAPLDDDTFVRMNSAPVPLAPVRGDAPDAVDPLDALVPPD